MFFSDLPVSALFTCISLLESVLFGTCAIIASFSTAVDRASTEECPHLANAYLNFGSLSIGPLAGTWQWTKDGDVCVRLLIIDSGTCIMLWQCDGVLADGVNCALWLWSVFFSKRFTKVINLLVVLISAIVSRSQTAFPAKAVWLREKLKQCKVLHDNYIIPHSLLK